MALVFFVFSAFSHASSSLPAEQQCTDCHQQQVSSWQRSDHAKAMAIADKNTVLGDFNNAKVSHYSQSVHFYKKAAAYFADLTEQNKTTTYKIEYTFGHYPLQQYLVRTDADKLQILSFAWDSQPKEQGGQRWYPNYANEDVKPQDRLHWQQPLQNWNGMCADCHSDGLKRNYDLKTNTFDSHWDNINVGCQSCHGKMTEHHKSAAPSSKQSLINRHFTNSYQQQQKALAWLLEDGEKVARLRNSDGQLASMEEKQQRQKFMDNCFSCHALRTPLTDGIQPNVEFLDQFSPTLISQPFYHADGQIKEEVYVYGSFLQSKMFANGVTCVDCHDAHSMKIKSDTNGLCLQCHSPTDYQTEKHTHHPLDSKAGQCVNCHMPETTYMGVDDRRDHSFRVPRPNLSEVIDSPNACTNCHQDKNNQWAANQLEGWFGKPKELSRGEQLFIQLLHQQALPVEQHIELINDKTLNAIKRASALALLPNSVQSVSDAMVKPWVQSELPLIRLAAARIGRALSPQDLQRSYKSLLTDEYKAVRVAAAEHLVGLGLHQADTIQQAFTELTAANQVSSWRGEGNLNRSLELFKLGKQQGGIDALKNSIEVEPYFVPAYINLAEIYRQMGLVEEEKLTFDKALKNNPNSGTLQYSWGMAMIRSGDKVGSVNAFKKAIRLEPNNPQFAYLYFLALDSTGNTKKALRELKLSYKRYQSRQLLELGVNFARKLNDAESYNQLLNMQ